MLAVLASVAPGAPEARAETHAQPNAAAERARSHSLPVFGPDTVPVGKGKKARYFTYGASVNRRKNPACGKDHRCWVPYVVHQHGAYLGKRKKITGDALHHPGAWVDMSRKHNGKRRKVWSPSVVRHNGRYYLFYTATRKGTVHSPDSRGRKCIGVAVSQRPRGPFKARKKPLVCHKGGWAIDADAFTGPHNGNLYMAYRDDAATTGHQTAITVVRLSDNARHIQKRRRLLTSRDVSWEQQNGKKNSHIIENPSMIRAKGTWWLFYSGNRWQTPKYSTGIAKCGKGPMPKNGCTPYRTRRRPHFGFVGDGGLKKPHKPLARLPHNEIAPGAMDVFRAHGTHGLRVVWNYKVKRKGSERRSMLGKLTFRNHQWRVTQPHHGS